MTQEQRKIQVKERESAMTQSLVMGVTRLLIAGILMIFMVANVVGQTTSDTLTTVPDEGFSYRYFTTVLNKYVNDKGMVDYNGLKANREGLDRFAEQIAEIPSTVYHTWKDREKIAFWTNAYNAFTLKLIIDNYPIKSSFAASLRFPKNSIRQIPGHWDKVKFSIMGKEMTLTDIEHNTLRKDFNEPRIHMALVCAAMGCPPLLNEPYTAEKLYEQFADRTKALLADPQKFRIDRKKKRVFLSPIFTWFEDDFIKTYGTDEKFKEFSKGKRAVLNFISPFLSDTDRTFLVETEKFSIKYLDYDWSLNEQQSS